MFESTGIMSRAAGTSPIPCRMPRAQQVKGQGGRWERRSAGNLPRRSAIQHLECVGHYAHVVAPVPDQTPYGLLTPYGSRPSRRQLAGCAFVPGKERRRSRREPQREAVRNSAGAPGAAALISPSRGRAIATVTYPFATTGAGPPRPSCARDARRSRQPPPGWAPCFRLRIPPPRCWSPKTSPRNRGLPPGRRSYLAVQGHGRPWEAMGPRL